MNGEEAAQGPKEGRGMHRRALIIFVVWILFTATVLAIGLPIVHQSIQKSGVLNLLGTATERPKSQTQSVSVWFFTADRTLRAFRQRQQRKGGSTYHDTFESLLGGPDLQALKEGAVSWIQKGSRLIGLTLSNKVLYVDLSKEFLQSPDLDGAYEQLRRTATGFPQVKDMVLLIEGERFALPAVR